MGLHKVYIWGCGWTYLQEALRSLKIVRVIFENLTNHKAFLVAL